MFLLSFKDWGSSHGVFFTKERLYYTDSKTGTKKWTPFVRVSKRYPTWFGHWGPAYHLYQSNSTSTDCCAPVEVSKPMLVNSNVVQLPDGSGFSVMSFSLPKSHWIYQRDEETENELPIHVLTNPRIVSYEERRASMVPAVREAIRQSTANGTEPDFDPDALVMNVLNNILGLPPIDFIRRRQNESA